MAARVFPGATGNTADTFRDRVKPLAKDAELVAWPGKNEHFTKRTWFCKHET